MQERPLRRMRIKNQQKENLKQIIHNHGDNYTCRV